MLLLAHFAESPLSNLNNPRTPLLTSSRLDIEAYPKAMELLISNKILTTPLMSDLPLPPINDTDHPVFLSKLEAKLNNNQFPTIYEPTYIAVFSPLLTNDSPPIIVTTIPLLNDNEFDVKLNDSQSSLDYTSTFIVTDSSFLLSPQSTPTIIDPSAPIQNT